jgi:alkyl sulfatase BDS1-like metallo-beta-lactamase superfamily hydrolase
MTSRPVFDPAVLTACALLALGGCGEREAPVSRLVPSQDDGSGHTAPTEHTARANAAVLDQLPFDDRSDFENARRGHLASLEPPIVLDAGGNEVWNLERYAFQTGESPDSVNPSLWRQAQLNAIHGLFQVDERIYQVRGYDLANMTLVAGDTGWIVIDPLTTVETARAAMGLVASHLGERPVQALVYTHSHIDHFGGGAGVLDDSDLARGVPVIAPEGFLVEAVSENVLAGNAMSRRALYMFGFLLGRGPREHVDSGLGKSSTPGSFSLIPPTVTITETGTRMEIDGVELVFQNTPGAEAPAEMMLYLPQWRALCGAENVSHVLHNVYTLRGAKVRDALQWSRYLDETLALFGDAEVLFASHHWPTWGNAAIRDYLKKQRDAYKFLHDQTLRLANRGLTPNEIAEQLELPPSLAGTFAVRGYYGTVRHNAKAVYQHYLGWFDGNPAHLDPLPEADAARLYVEYMGGADAVVARARAAYEEGNYRWVATVLNHVIFADPSHAGARSLLADAYDQLGYQAESGPWRDFYLTGALELREGRGASPLRPEGTAAVVASMPTSLFFDALAVRMDGLDAAESPSVINFVFTDIGETHVVEVENGVLHHHQGEARADADATVRLTRAAWNRLATNQASPKSLVLDGELSVDGSLLTLVGFFARLDEIRPSFEIVRP